MDFRHDSRKVLLIENGVAGTSFTPTAELNQGRIRIWVRANLNDATSTDWSAPRDVNRQCSAADHRAGEQSGRGNAEENR